MIQTKKFKKSTALSNINKEKEVDYFVPSILGKSHPCLMIRSYILKILRGINNTESISLFGQALEEINNNSQKLI